MSYTDLCGNNLALQCISGPYCSLLDFLITFESFLKFSWCSVDTTLSSNLSGTVFELGIFWAPKQCISGPYFSLLDVVNISDSFLK